MLGSRTWSLAPRLDAARWRWELLLAERTAARDRSRPSGAWFTASAPPRASPPAAHTSAPEATAARPALPAWREALEDRPPHRDQRRSPDCLLVHAASVVQASMGVSDPFQAHVLAHGEQLMAQAESPRCSTASVAQASHRAGIRAGEGRHEGRISEKLVDRLAQRLLHELR